MGLIKVTDCEGDVRLFDEYTYEPYTLNTNVSLVFNWDQLQGAKFLYEVCIANKVQAVKIIRCFCCMGISEAKRLYELAEAEVKRMQQ